MAVSDRRVKRTQRLLAEALISLTLEKGYNAVSIRDITERADVAYATFFRHYDDKDALLDEVLDVILDDMLNILHPPPEESPVTAAIKIFEFVQSHTELARVLLGSKGKDDLIQRLIANKQYFAPSAASNIPPEIVTNHFMSASIEMIQWWLDHDMPYPPDQMGRIFATLILLPSQELADPC
jgi:AcrR family transcriptional regulator